MLYSAAFLRQLQRATADFGRKYDVAVASYAERVEFSVHMPLAGARGQVATERLVRAHFRTTARRIRFELHTDHHRRRPQRWLTVVLWPRAGLLPADPSAVSIPTTIGRVTKALTFHGTPL